MTSLRTTCPGCSAKLRIRSGRTPGRKIRCPKCQTEFVAAVVEPPSSEISTSKPVDVPRPVDVGVDSNGSPIIQTEDPVSIAARIRKRKRIKSAHGWIVLLLVVATGASLWWIVEANRTSESAGQHQKSPAESSVSAGAEKAVVDVALTPVDPIPLNFIPVVPQLLLHLRPAELWANVEPYREFSATLGNLGTWLRGFIEESTRFDVSEIAELTVAVNFGSRGSVPDVAMVVRTVEEHAESHLLQHRIQGRMVANLNGEIIAAGGFGWMVVDSRTIAMATVELAEELAESRRFPAVPSANIESMVRVSNRKQPVTIFADLQVLDAHKDLILVEQLHQVAEAFLLWLLPDTGTLSWSMHLEPHLTMETRLAPTAECTSVGLQRRVVSQLSSLPDQLVNLVATLSPRTSGHARIIARFPAMIQALELGTRVMVADGMAVMKTVLPQKAAANLAAGATLTWNQTVVQSIPADAADTRVAAKDNVTLTEQLNRKVLVDFRRAPLHEAIEFLGQSLDVPLKIDGDALMLAGFTQNMPQTHDLGTVTVLQALNVILAQYDGRMVITHDSTQSSLLLTTEEAVGERTVLKTE